MKPTVMLVGLGGLGSVLLPCVQLAPAESEEGAKELIARFREYAERHGVRLQD